MDDVAAVAGMNKAEAAKLQRMIDRTVRTANEYQRAQATLNEWCAERYGCEPGDIDADAIIDAVFGGCGKSDGMSAKDFHATMLSAMPAEAKP